MKVDIQLAQLDEKHLLRKMLELCTYEFSEIQNFDLNEFGEFGYRYLDHYWTEPERYPYILRVKKKLAGFVLVNQATISGTSQNSIAEFFILKRYRGKGLGKILAYHVFDQFPGEWEVKTQKKNLTATHFWRKALYAYTLGRVKEHRDGLTGWDGPVWIFQSRTRENEATKPASS
jgi:predicted acetyltransferase